MQDFGTKADNSPPPGGQLSAAEFNNLATENENAVSRSGQTLSGASDTQLAQSLFLHSVKAGTFQDSGAANAYVATPVSGTNGVLLPSAYTNLGGAVLTFKASNANSGASTLNIGQTTGTLLGTKPIRTQTDVALPAGTIAAGQYIQVRYNSAFDGGTGAWELLPWTSATHSGRITATANGSLIVPDGVTQMAISAVAGGGGGGGGGGPVSGTNVGSGGGGGGAGQAIQDVIYTVTPLSTISWTIGSAGAKGIGVSGANGTAGGNGGNTVITGIPSGTVTLTAGSGGGGGLSGATPIAGAIGGAGFPRGGVGSDAIANGSPCCGAFGGSTPFGGGGSNGRGSGSGAPGAANNGSDADGYGGGGGSGGGYYTGASTQKGGDGGNGTPGFIKIEWN